MSVYVCLCDMYVSVSICVCVCICVHASTTTRKRGHEFEGEQGGYMGDVRRQKVKEENDVIKISKKKKKECDLCDRQFSPFYKTWHSIYPE